MVKHHCDKCDKAIDIVLSLTVWERDFSGRHESFSSKLDKEFCSWECMALEIEKRAKK